MRIIALFLIVLFYVNQASAGVFSPTQVKSLFTSFTKKYKKSYVGASLTTKLSVFERNLDIITKTNSLQKKFTLEVNNFADLTEEEFKKILLPPQKDDLKLVASNKIITGSKSRTMVASSSDKDKDKKKKETRKERKEREKREAEEAKKNKNKPTPAPVPPTPPPPEPLPENIDWNEKGMLQPIQNQGSCGSCWAFAAVGVFEGHHKIQTGESVKFSEQYFLDCASKDIPENAMGCDGAYTMPHIYDYMVKSNGFCTAEEYGPYQHKVTECKPCKKIGSIHNWISMNDNEKMLMKYVARAPVYGRLNASPSEFRFYKSGIIDVPAYSNVAVNHAIVISGYGSENGTDYWIIRNSWGETWGDKGYVKVVRNKNMLGIDSFPAVFSPYLGF